MRLNLLEKESHVSFVTPVNIDKNIRRQDDDGLLPTKSQRIFWCFGMSCS
jgi:hypothetical protein